MKIIAFRLVFGGNTLLAVFVILVLFSVFPLRVTQPEWLFGFADTILSTAGFSLVALIFISISPYFDPDNQALVKQVRKILRLACIASLSFLLLIPLNFYLAYRFVSIFRDQEVNQYNAMITRANFFAQKVSEASTFDNLQEVMKVYQATQLPEAERAKPLGLTKTFLLGKIKEAIAELKKSRKFDLLIQKTWQQYQIAVRNSLLSLAYALAFAALAQRRNSEQSLLQDIMTNFLNFLYSSLQSREQKLASAGEQSGSQLLVESSIVSQSFSGSNRQETNYRDGSEGHNDLIADSGQMAPGSTDLQFDHSAGLSTAPPRATRFFPWFRSAARRRQDEQDSFFSSLAEQQESDSLLPNDHHASENTEVLPSRLSAGDSGLPRQNRAAVIPTRRQKISDLDYFEQLAEDHQDSDETPTAVDQPKSQP